MPLIVSGNVQYRERDLFFNKERILRWMRRARRKKDLHPDLLTHELECRRAADRFSILRRLSRRSI